MFQGSIPGDMQKIVRETIRSWNVPELYVGCSGNLTVERGVRDLKMSLHSCDVNIYSCTIGSYFAGHLHDIHLSEYGLETYGFMQATMGSDADRVATVVLASGLTTQPGKGTSYYSRLTRQYERQWTRMHAETKAKLLKMSETFKLDQFDAEDVFTWVDRIPPEAGFVSFPPFSPRGYVDMYEELDKAFDWPEPSFQLVNTERKYDFLRRASDREHWMFCLDYEEPDFADNLRGVALTSARGVKVRIYSSDGPVRYVAPHQTSHSPLIPHLPKTYEIRADSRIAISELKLDQFNAVRSRYLATNIAPGSASFAFGVMIDGYLAGVLAFSNASSPIDMSSHVPTPNIYMMSDFAVDGSAYKQLSKLIVAAAVSNEIKFLIERNGNRRYRSLTTTAFSRHPESMKYRGVIRRLTSKRDDEKNEYVLTYGSELGRWSLQEAFDNWFKKNGAADGRAA
jgi:hypothetical protein